jgi:AcrR family transcriptional regulator
MGMVRWEPDSRGRLEKAALELYGERGFENTTVAEIAARAGLTERTFFRHYTDKREVLFWGAGALQELLVNAVADAPAVASPIDAVAAALETAGAMLQQRREYARQTPGRDRCQRGAARARADQARITRSRDRRHSARAGSQRASCELDRRSGDRRIQSRV